LMTEREHIITDSEEPVVKNKKPKIRKRTVMMTPGYFREIQDTSATKEPKELSNDSHT